MNSELSYGTLQLKVIREFSAKVFSPSIGMQAFDDSLVLSTQPGLISAIAGEGFVLLADKVNIGEPTVIICETDEILFSVDSRDRRWSPNV